MQNSSNYTLDFIIPIGPTGPTGPQGIEGITGPTGPASLSALIFSDFNSMPKQGYLTIYKNTILPTNSPVFIPSSDQINITEPGNYEFIISGTIGGLSANEIISISMEVQSEDGMKYSVMLASIVADANQECFAQTMLLTFEKKQTIKLYLRKNDIYNSSAETVNLLIKKLAF